MYVHLFYTLHRMIVKFYAFFHEYFSDTVRKKLISYVEPFNITDKKVVDSLSMTLDYSGKYLDDYGFPNDCKLTTTSLPLSISTTLSHHYPLISLQTF